MKIKKTFHIKIISALGVSVLLLISTKYAYATNITMKTHLRLPSQSSTKEFEERFISVATRISLTRMEQRVLELLADGVSRKRINKILRTDAIYGYLKRVHNKLYGYWKPGYLPSELVEKAMEAEVIPYNEEKLKRLRIKDQYTPAELYLLSYLSKGYSPKQISRLRNTSVEAVEITLADIRKKMELSTLSAILEKALTDGLIEENDIVLTTIKGLKRKEKLPLFGSRAFETIRLILIEGKSYKDIAGTSKKKYVTVMNHIAIMHNAVGIPGEKRLSVFLEKLFKAGYFDHLNPAIIKARIHKLKQEEASILAKDEIDIADLYVKLTLEYGAALSDEDFMALCPFDSRQVFLNIKNMIRRKLGTEKGKHKNMGDILLEAYKKGLSLELNHTDHEMDSFFKIIEDRDKLIPSQKNILIFQAFIGKGITIKDIASLLNVSHDTINVVNCHIRDRLGFKQGSKRQRIKIATVINRALCIQEITESDIIDLALEQKKSLVLIQNAIDSGYLKETNRVLNNLKILLLNKGRLRFFIEEIKVLENDTSGITKLHLNDLKGSICIKVGCNNLTLIRLAYKVFLLDKEAQKTIATIKNSERDPDEDSSGDLWRQAGFIEVIESLDNLAVREFMEEEPIDFSIPPVVNKGMHRGLRTNL